MSPKKGERIFLVKFTHTDFERSYKIWWLLNYRWHFNGMINSKCQNSVVLSLICLTFWTIHPCPNIPRQDLCILQKSQPITVCFLVKNTNVIENSHTIRYVWTISPHHNSDQDLKQVRSGVHQPDYPPLCPQSLSEKGFHWWRSLPSWGTWPAGVGSCVSVLLPPAERSAPLSSSWVESRKRSDVSGSQRGRTTCSQDPHGGVSSGDFQQLHHPHRFCPELQPDYSANPENKQVEETRFYHPVAQKCLCVLWKRC